MVLLILVLAALNGTLTGTLTVQEPEVVPLEAGMTPPTIENDVLPGTAVMMPPTQVVVGAGLAATVSGLVRLSVRLVTISGTAKGLRSTIETVCTLPAISIAEPA
ncbi:hypothetical protein D3C72_1739110 [compost metagenome]